MCEKKPYCARRIDPCIAYEVECINKYIKNVKTIASCCGHGKYPKTIIVKDTITGKVWEFNSNVVLADKPRKSHKYYKKDSDGIYYIPEVSSEQI